MRHHLQSMNKLPHQGKMPGVDFLTENIAEDLRLAGNVETVPMTQAWVSQADLRDHPQPQVPGHR